ncbi:LMBR1-like membrane protein domain-containing protein [Phthorimaea operculella]|nr:LMBR1-like membrane protein domain-containing protein [Phthorimaea operculella]
MFVLPLDVSSTVYRQCLDNTTTVVATSSATPAANGSTPAPTPESQCQQPWSFVPDEVFRNLWRVLYWTSQCLTWLIMPMMQSYSKAGDFTVKGKLKSALVDNAIYYGSYLFICGILLIYLALQPGVSLDGPKIKAIASSASNTWGLFLLILLLGYALVEVPRNLWNNSKKNYTLTYSYFKIAKLSTDKCEAEENVDDILDSLNAVNAAVGPGHPLHRHVEIVIQKLPIQLRDRLNHRAPPERPNAPSMKSLVNLHKKKLPIQLRDRLNHRAPPERPNAPSMKSLVNLHKKTIKALHTLQRTETQWGLMLERIFHLEDVAANLRSPDKRFQHTFLTARPRPMRILYPPTVVAPLRDARTRNASTTASTRAKFTHAICTALNEVNFARAPVRAYFCRAAEALEYP